MSNIVAITGNIGRAPALNFTANGTAAWGFSLAYTPSRKTDAGWEDTGPTLWFDVTVWGEDAVDLADRYNGIEKGRATVVGRIGSRSWTNKEGVEQTSMTITAEAITIHPRKDQRQAPQPQSGGWGGQQPQQPATDPWNQGQQQQWGGQTEQAPF